MLSHLQISNPLPLYMDKGSVVADLAVSLTSQPEFSFNGILSKNILIHDQGQPLQCDTKLVGNTARKPLVAFVDPDMCEF